MIYGEEIIEEVRSRNDIVDLISTYVPLKKKGSSYFGLCPFHNEKSPSFSVSRDKQMYYCFGCGAGGNVFTFLMEYENFSFPEALKYLAERAGMELPEEELNEEAKRAMDEKARLREMNKLSANYFYYLLHSKRGQKGLAYLKDRGITDATIKHFGLGYADIYNDDLYRFLKSKGYSDEDLKDSALVTIDERRGGSDKFWNRVMFPIMDVNNRVIGFGGRVMGDGSPKYLNSKETKLFDKSRNLYGLNFARSSRKKEIILCVKAPTVVIVDDRIDLEDQITGDFTRAEIPNIDSISSKQELEEKIHQRKILITTIFKFGDLNDGEVIDERDNIILLMDEAHRTQEGDLGKKMRTALPNAFFFGLTGTPINRNDHNTFACFGAEEDKYGYISKYTFQNSVADGATLELNFKTVPVEMHLDDAKLQKEFDELTDQISEEDKNELVRRTSVDAFFTAEKRINDVCKYIVSHFREYVKPTGMKAQVVVYNRECCVKYKKALDALLGTDDQTTIVMHTAGDNP